MELLLATYNFYPYSWGGSEVYVAGLAQYLINQNWKVNLIAAVPDQAFEQYGVLWEGRCIKICTYNQNGINVFGVQHSLNTADIYKKYTAEWEQDWRSFFTYLQVNLKFNPVLLHLHGFTAIIGLALVKAFHYLYQEARIFATYHTPISCPKGTLLQWEKKECNLEASLVNCCACTWQAQTGWPHWLAKSTMALLPSLEWAKLPTPLRWKALIGSAVQAFQELSSLVNHWWVFSEQIRSVLLKQDINAEQISLGRHGIAPVYVHQSSHNRSESPKVFAFVGRFKAIKGVETLLQAWSNLPFQNSRQLWLIGNSNDADPRIQSVLERLASRDDIRIYGPQSEVELAQLYKQIHVLIVPSEWVEIGPLVIHEAVATGANIIASDRGGTKELAYHYATVSSLFPMGDVKALQHCIETFEYKPQYPRVETQAEHYAKILHWYQK